MTPLHEFKSVWEKASADLTIGEEDVRMLLRNRSSNLKKEILKRLTSEIMTYLLIGLSLLCVSLVGGFGPGRAFFLGTLALLVLVPSIAVLAYKEYRLRTLPMSGTLRESTSNLIKTIDSTARLYFFAYVASIIVSVAAIEILLISRKGWNLLTMISILAAPAFVRWAYLSGRRYASRMFLRYRSELVSVLSELESQ